MPKSKSNTRPDNRRQKELSRRGVKPGGKSPGKRAQDRRTVKGLVSRTKGNLQETSRVLSNISIVNKDKKY